MNTDHWIIFIVGAVAGALTVYLKQFIEEILDRREWTWYDDDEHLTGVEARRRLYKGDDQ